MCVCVCVCVCERKHHPQALHYRFGSCLSGDPHRASGFRVQGSGYRVHGSGYRVQASEFRVSKDLMLTKEVITWTAAG